MVLSSLIKRKDSPQYDVRVQLMNICCKNYLTYNDLSHQVGISAGTIHRFLGKEFDVRKRTLFKILKYIETVEKTGLALF